MTGRPARGELWLVLLLTLAVSLPRSLLVVHAHSEAWDDQYHLARGIAFWTDRSFDEYLNDPPLGAGIIALPMLAAGCTIDGPLSSPFVVPYYNYSRYAVLYGQPISPEAIQKLVAAWKSLLFACGAVLVFAWVRTIYNRGAAWLAVTALLFEPTMIAHTPVAALDMLAMFAWVGTSWLLWRWAQKPTPARLLAASAATAATMLIKHIAIILPVVAIAMAVVVEYARPTPGCNGLARRLRLVFNRVGAGALLTCLFIWAFTLFDFARPNQYCRIYSGIYDEQWRFVSDMVNPLLARRWPAGIYIGSLAEAAGHVIFEGGASMMGQRFEHGSWLYHPVAASYKVPIGMAVFVAVGLASLVIIRPRWRELGLLIPLVLYLLQLLTMSVQSGFRHALPAYLMIIMLASRCMLLRSIAWRGIAWAGVIVAAVDAARWHPNYLSYRNWPRGTWFWWWADEANIDWGQSLKQVRQWIDARRSTGSAEVMYLSYYGDVSRIPPQYHLGDRVVELPEGPLPREGMLIVSPYFIMDKGRPGGRFALLRDRRPDDVIGQAMLVYDLGKLHDLRD